MILLVAYGNELRQDDGAGLLLAQMLERRWQAAGCRVRRIAVQQLTPELAPDIAGSDVSAVVFVDSRISAQLTGEAVDVTPLQAPVGSSPCLGHHLQPEALLSIAEQLYARPASAPAWLVTVPGVAFGYGDTISETAQVAIRAALDASDSALHALLGHQAIARSCQ